MRGLEPPAPRKVGPLSRTDFVRYAGAAGDFNPVHHDDGYAQEQGFPSVFAMGMFPAGLVGSYVAGWLGVQQVTQLDIRFVSPTWPGDVLVLSAADVTGDGDSGCARVSVAAGGDVRITAAVAFGVAALDRPAPAPTPDEPRLRHMLDDVVLEPVELPVERGKILEFARATHAGGVHTDAAEAAAAGFADLPAPPTFTNVVAHWSGGDATAVPLSVGLDLARVVHAEQRYTFHRPIVAGQTLRGGRRVSSAYAKQSKSGADMTFVTVTTSFAGDDGQPVVDEDMVMLERGAKKT